MLALTIKHKLAAGIKTCPRTIDPLPDKYTKSINEPTESKAAFERAALFKDSASRNWASAVVNSTAARANNRDKTRKNSTLT
ncbi:hypothetical protein AUJ14_01755 [Candidatus Micrarchaeota archaeon CG1_02_55_22]|nr:MAG: hypothetical protein AUJ14_01755 [Candidatus Micrarchaeota archaeon CG1_02_55_22]